VHVAVCCSLLQFVTVCCSVLQCVAVCFNVLQCVAVCCSVFVDFLSVHMCFPACTCVYLWICRDAGPAVSHLALSRIVLTDTHTNSLACTPFPSRSLAPSIPFSFTRARASALCLQTGGNIRRQTDSKCYHEGLLHPAMTWLPPQ